MHLSHIPNIFLTVCKRLLLFTNNAILCIVLCTAISVGWERTVYTATESNSVEVCGIAYSAKPVTVVVYSQDGTAGIECIH